MRFRPCFWFLVLLPAWQVELAQEPGRASPPDGAMIYTQNCAKCHGVEGAGVNALISIAGPSLQAVHDRQHILQMVRDGKGIMPTFSRLLAPQQIDAVVDYVLQHIAVISLPPGNLSDGGHLYRVYCAACHRTEIRGGALAFAGTNAPPLTGSTPSTIAGAIRSGPGPMPSFPPSVLDDKQVASIIDYVQFMQNPPSPGGNPLHFYGPVVEGLVGWAVMFILIGTTGWIERKGKG